MGQRGRKTARRFSNLERLALILSIAGFIVGFFALAETAETATEGYTFRQGGRAAAFARIMHLLAHQDVEPRLRAIGYLYASAVVASCIAIVWLGNGWHRRGRERYRPSSDS